MYYISRQIKNSLLFLLGVFLFLALFGALSPGVASAGIGESDCREDYGKQVGGSSSNSFVLGYYDTVTRDNVRTPVCGDRIDGSLGFALFEWEQSTERWFWGDDHNSVSGIPWIYAFTTPGGEHVFTKFSDLSSFQSNPEELNDAFQRGNVVYITDSLRLKRTGQPEVRVDDPLGVISQLRSGEQRDIGLPDDFDVVDAIDNPDDEELPETCEERDGTSFGFVTCWALGAITSALNFVDGVLAEMLRTPNDFIESSAVEEAWATFRNFAYLLLVPILFLMVIGTALGFEFVSAYTVKKALPRMVAATIFIALSFEIVKFLIVVTNAFGVGIQGLLAGAGGFDGGFTLQDMFRPTLGADALTVVLGIGATVAVAPWIINGGAFVILGFLASAVIALVTLLFLLAFRQVAIMILAILAPLAILAWIFPGNTRMWSLWRSTFLKLLLLYPVIMLAIGAGKLFAGVLAGIQGDIQLDSASDSGAISVLTNRILILVGYVGPYFFIPKLFKTAGGAFANLAGMARDKESGILNRVKGAGKKRQESAQRYVARQTRKQTAADSRTRKGRNRGLNQMLDSGEQAIEGDNIIANTRRGYRERRRGKLDDTTVYSMQEQLKKEELSAETYKLMGDIEQKPRNDQLTYLQEKAKASDTSLAQKKAAINLLTQNQAVEQLHNVREFGAGNSEVAQEVAEAWNSVTPGNYPDWKKMSVGLAGGVQPGTPIEKLRATTASGYRNAGDAELAVMKPGGWTQWETNIQGSNMDDSEKADAIANMKQRYVDVMNNVEIRSTVSQEVITHFEKTYGIAAPKPTIHPPGSTPLS